MQQLDFCTVKSRSMFFFFFIIILNFCLKKFATQKKGGREKGCFELLNFEKQLHKRICRLCNQIESERRMAALTSGGQS